MYVSDYENQMQHGDTGAFAKAAKLPWLPYETYENDPSRQVTNHRAECSELQKRGGGHAYNQWAMPAAGDDERGQRLTDGLRCPPMQLLPARLRARLRDE